MSTKKNPFAGRPTKLTPDLQEEICNAIFAGNYIHIAASAAGISRDTLNEWMRSGARERARREKGEAPDSKLDQLVLFSDAIRTAMAKGEARNVAAIANSKDWKARMELLARMYPSRWGRRDRVTVESHAGTTEGDGGATEQEQLERILSDPDARDAFDALAARLARESGGDS